MTDTDVLRESLAERVVQIAQMHDARIDDENLQRMRSFLKPDKTPCGHDYMGSIVKLNYLGNALDKITIERPYQIRDVNDKPLTLTETYRVFSRAR
ncbi:MAG: hypothetical protein US31_C0015G0003 [Berkelbacteria bacterium GW2011_GWA1_36_9]|uniref:Uncharacterized protein n=1 Tax=Berkelbacteria bacterium GW2011_GWA1_36_9 TaxID=1618331 RepID=A0A0G0FJ46_9BACT|nr:MAG: hypothetical protein US31_C0015G0003 [Berkelbacteria bacterium GW2011_GWA1_36_9]